MKVQTWQQNEKTLHTLPTPLFSSLIFAPGSPIPQTPCSFSQWNADSETVF